MSRVVLFSLLLAGCRTEPLERPIDGGGAVNPQPTGCQTHTRTPVALQSITLLDPTSRLQSEVVVRVALHLSLRPCDLLGDVQVSSAIDDTGSQLFSIAVSAWLGSAGCGGARAVTRALVLEGVTSQQLLVSDLNSAASLLIKLKGRQTTDCSAVGIGQACQLDCQCANTDRSARCVVGVCALPCAEDVDCPADRPQCAATATTPYVCRPASGGCGTCGFNQACSGGVCQRPVQSGIGACACDSDCGGAMCQEEDHFCTQPCTTDADCPIPGSGCSSGQCFTPV